MNLNSHSFKNRIKLFRSIPLYFLKTRLAWLQKFSIPLMGGLAFRKTLAVVDADMAKFAHVQHVIVAQIVGIHHAVRLDFLLDHG